MTLNKKLKKFAELKPRRCLNPFSPLFGVKVKPYLSANEIALATANCIAEFFRVSPDNVVGDDGKLMLTRYDLFENVQLALDVVVLEHCTNIGSQGLEWDDLVGSGAMQALRKKVKNYSDTWDIIKTALSLKNTYAGLNIVSQRIPDPEAMEKNARELATLIKQLNEEYPDMVQKITDSTVMAYGTVNARTEAKKETVAKKSS